MSDTSASAPRSRRALLSAAAGAAAAVAATAVVPAATLANDPDDVVKGVDNDTTEVTRILQQTDDKDAFDAWGSGTGVGIIGRTDLSEKAGVVGLSGDALDAVFTTGDFEIDAGVYGYAAQTPISAGVLGEGPTGVYGYGDWGVYADGAEVGVFARAYPSGTAVHAHAGAGDPPPLANNVALRGTVTSPSQVGIQAYGRVMFPNRSGRVTVAAGQRIKAVTVRGVRPGNAAFAVLNANRSGVVVRAVVPGTNRITIYLNKRVASATSVAWLVLG